MAWIRAIPWERLRCLSSRRPFDPVALTLAVLALLALAGGAYMGSRASGGDDASGGFSGPSLVTSPAWDPLTRQEIEPDTLFLLDPEVERQRIPGDGGFIMGDAPAGDLPWRSDSKVVVAPGRYRDGLSSRDRRYGYVWMPVAGLLPAREFTVEMWLKSERPWSQVDDTPFAAMAGGIAKGLSLQVLSGEIRLSYAHDQDPRGPISATLISKAAIAADQWVNVAFTLRSGTLSLYVDGVLAASQDGLEPMRVVSDTARADGLSIGGAGGKGATDLTVSDLRVSAKARTPGRTTRVPTRATLAVDPGRVTGGRVSRLLLGGLHTLGTPRTERMSRGALRTLRTDKLLVATPIKRGPPNAAHPSQGISGSYSYDWRVVDRTFRYYRRLGVLPYISVDATPRLLGGSVPPFSGDLLARQRSYVSGFPPEVPRDMAAYGQIVRDLVHHVVVERNERVPYWGVWNEPDGPGFWKGTLPDYLRLYDTVARAVKSVSPRLQVGGPETASWNPIWTEALIRHAASSQVPLDFLSWHYYSGNLGEVPEAGSRVRSWTRRYGLPRPPKLIVGEWAWQLANVPRIGAAPFASRNYFLNDWAAGFAASSLIEMQAAGVVMSIYTNPVAEARNSGPEASGLMSSRHPWATLNVFRLWSKLAPKIVDARLESAPGVSAQASTDGSGRLTVLLSRLQYRPGPDLPVELLLPEYASDARVVRHYVVDADHSNAFDAGVANAELDTLPDAIDGRRIGVMMQPRSVHLLVLDLPRES